MNESVKKFIKNYIGYLSILFVCAAYVGVALVTIDSTGKTPMQVVSDGVLAFFLGVCINDFFYIQGVLNGERDALYKGTQESHGQAVSKIAASIDRLDDWCEMENERNYRTQRTKILASVGLKYTDCFDEEGIAKEWMPDQEKLTNKLYRRGELAKVKAFKKATRLRLAMLTASTLTCDGSKEEDLNYLGKTKKEHAREMTVFDVGVKLVIALFFGFCSVSLNPNVNYATIIWMVSQLAFFVVMGVIKMHKAHGFIVDDYRSRIIMKIDKLQKFEAYIKANPIVEIVEVDNGSKTEI